MVQPVLLPLQLGPALAVLGVNSGFIFLNLVLGFLQDTLGLISGFGYHPGGLSLSDTELPVEDHSTPEKSCRTAKNKAYDKTKEDCNIFYSSHFSPFL